jgi:hypothetical protein
MRIFQIELHDVEGKNFKFISQNSSCDEKAHLIEEVVVMYGSWMQRALDLSRFYCLVPFGDMLDDLYSDCLFDELADCWSLKDILSGEHF